MNEIVLILDRKVSALWIKMEGVKISVGWTVDGLKKEEHENYYRVFRKGKPIGIVWDVKEVKEEW